MIGSVEVSASKHSPKNSPHRNGRLPSAENGIIVTDVALKPIAADTGAMAILRHFGCEGGEWDNPSPLPTAILEALAVPDGTEVPAVRNAHFHNGHDQYSCRAHVLGGGNGEPVARMIVLVLRKGTPIDDAILEMAPEVRLTDREQEVLRGISLGLTSKELATQMNISPNTVKVFLRQIMIKMGVTNRAGIVGKLLNHNE